jgi:AGCS family alanine or glycine:cation symporter
VEYLNEFLVSVLPYTEWVMLFLVVGGGLFLTIYSRLLPFRYFKHAIEITAGKHDDPNAPGEVSHFQALSSAVAATVGMGNIAGVAIAIYLGGPGVVFWIWMTALIGMAIKYYSCTLAVMYRGVNPQGMVQGGPMHYMVQGIGPKAKGLAVFFSVAGLFGVLPAFTANQLVQTLVDVVEPQSWTPITDPWTWKLILGLTLSALTVGVIFGGLKKIARVASSMVPPMVLVYLGSVLWILINSWSEVPGVFALIFEEAFNTRTMVQGGLWGLIIVGIRRAIFSNESGVGLAPMFHGQSKSTYAVQEGLVAMLGPFIDTIVVCTLTALVILVSGVYLEGGSNGILMTLEAFRAFFGPYGAVLLLVVVVAFGLSTLFTYAYYGTKCLDFLSDYRWGYRYNYIYIFSITFAAVASVDLVINIIDLSFALMCIPNMIALLYLAPRVNAAARDYFKRP